MSAILEHLSENVSDLIFSFIIFSLCFVIFLGKFHIFGLIFLYDLKPFYVFMDFVDINLENITNKDKFEIMQLSLSRHFK